MNAHPDPAREPAYVIEGCPLAVQCDKQWQDLLTTSNERERNCPDCQSVVTLCVDQDELLRLSDEGKCVAFSIRTGSRTVRLMGLPAMSDKLRKYLDDLES